MSSTKPLRKLAIANFSTKLARLNAIMEEVDGSTHVPALNSWRDQGYEADFIQDLTRGAGEPKAKTARELLSFLCDGAPPVRLALQEIIAVHAIEKVDKAKYNGHQKVIFAEVSPVNAWYLMAALREGLIDARVMHAGLSNKAKTELQDLFNDPNSTLKVLIMMYDVGAIGLNLHEACNKVVLLSIPRNRGQEEQTGGRALRVSDFLSACQKYFPNTLQLITDIGDLRISGFPDSEDNPKFT